MKKIEKIGGGVNVTPMLWALQANPQLWNADKMRTMGESPHSEVDDIWCRYAADPLDMGPHESVWYPAASVLPVREIVYPLMQYVRGERLGGVLITRIRAGKECKRHKDVGWHARHYDKYAVQIQSSPGQKFCFEGEELEPMPGDIYTFLNEYEHWVLNPSEHDRITMIVCIQTDKG